MAVNSSRSQRRDFLEGSVDGKYRKVRPDTEVIPGMGDAETRLNRSHLYSGFPTGGGYGYLTQQVPLEQMEYPGG